MASNLATVSWSSFVSLQQNATLKDFNVYNYTVDSNNALFTQTGSWSSGAQTFKNETTYFYGFATIVNAVAKQAAGNVLASWVAPKWVTGNAALYAVYMCRTASTGTTTISTSASTALYTSTFDPAQQIGAVANLTAGMTTITDSTQKQFTTFTPVGASTNGQLVCANYRSLSDSSTNFNSLKWGNSVVFRSGFTFWNNSTTTVQNTTTTGTNDF